MTHISSLPITKPLALLCDSPWVHEIEAWNVVKDECFTVGINYFDRFKTDLQFFVDSNVEPWKKKDRPICSKKHNGNAYDLDYYFEGDENQWISHDKYAPWQALSLFRGLVEGPIYLFGFDFSADRRKREVHGDVLISLDDRYSKILDDVKVLIESECKNEFFDAVFNCGPKSTLTVFPKLDYWGKSGTE